MSKALRYRLFRVGWMPARSHGEVAPRATAAGSVYTPVIQSVLSPPRWFTGDDGRVHLEYELLLTNAFPVAVHVASLEVLGGGGARIARLSGQRLTAAMGWPGVKARRPSWDRSASGLCGSI